MRPKRVNSDSCPRNGWLLSSLLTALLGLAAVLSSPAAERPKVLINEAEFRDRVHACWLGKNIGGTLGMPFEGKKEPQNITYYSNIKPGEPAANDDLDLQLLWLKAMEEHGGRVDARILGGYWLKYVPVDWNEYGVGKKNMMLGLLPPLSGEYNNARWKHSNGAWIRSEIWACLAPGCPALAARMAREDACVDHGSGEGTLAEIFTASVESAAFIERDRDNLIAIGLSMIPADSNLAEAIRAVVEAKKAGKDWKTARLDVIRASEKTGWFQAPRNVAYMILGWLYGEGDFGKGLCTAVNCGDDTDCTGATLGSIFGILQGSRGIPQNWSQPIGDKIKTVAIKGVEHPGDLKELTDRTVAMTKRVLAQNAAPVSLSSGPTDMRQAGELTLSDPAAARALWTRSPYQIVWNENDVQVTLDYGGEPTIESNRPRNLEIMVRNLSRDNGLFRVAVLDLPEGWRVTGLPKSPLKVKGGESTTCRISVTASSGDLKPARCKLEVGGANRTITMPIALIPK